MADSDDREREIRSQDARREAIIGFLAAGQHDAPWQGLVVEALARARRAVAGYRARDRSGDDWLASEVRLREIRENAAVLAALEVPEWRARAAELYRREHPDREDLLSALPATLGEESATGTNGFQSIGWVWRAGRDKTGRPHWTVEAGRRGRMVDATEVDAVVVGLGVGGEEVAGRLAQAGLSVVGIEHRLVGGECPYWACVPSKMMIRAANLVAEGRRIDGMAGTATVEPDWAPVAKRIREEATDDWDDKVAVDRFTGKGGRFVRGFGRLAGSGRVEVDDQVFVAGRAVVVGVGTAPAVPPIEGLAGTPYWTNREAIEATEVPDSLVVLGGGPIGLELGQVFARFGSRVTVVEALDRLVAAEEPESSALVRDEFAKAGIDVRTGAKVERVAHDSQSFTVTLAGGDTLEAARLLVATGRRANLPDLGLDTVGLDPAAKALTVDDRLRVALPDGGSGLWAVGDVTGKGAFTHVAMYQADIVVRDILGQGGPGADYQALPRVTFTDPEIGSVGLTEAQARERGIAVRVGYTNLTESTRGWIHKAGNQGFIKLVEDADKGVLLGATSAGPVGGEVLGALVVAVHGQVPVDRLASMIYAYPTFHRAIEQAVKNLRK